MAALADVQEFLDFYVKGSNPPGKQLFFPGIRRRKPALLTSSLEFDELSGDGELDGVDVETFGPPDPDSPIANGLPAVFADICGLEDVVVEDDGAGGFVIIFVWCSDYPATALDPTSTERRRVVPLELSGQSGVVMAECMVKLREALGEELSDVDVATSLVRAPFEQLAATRRQILQGSDSL